MCWPRGSAVLHIAASPAHAKLTSDKISINPQNCCKAFLLRLADGR